MSNTNRNRTPDSGDGLVGKNVSARTLSSGVYTGTLQRLNKNEAILTDARRIWEGLDVAIPKLRLAEVTTISAI